MVDHIHLDSSENEPVPVELRPLNDPALPYIKERFKKDAAFLWEALQREKFYSKDPLTGVGSIHAFYDEVTSLVGSANRYLYGDQSERLALAHIDVDGLKEANDRYGHAEGDQLLKLVGDGLRRLSRPFDRVYRIGGDEFAVAMPGFLIPEPKKGEEILLAKVNHFQDGIAADIGKHNFAPTLQIGVSVGIALLNEGDNLQSLLARADQLQYQQKYLHRLEAAQANEE